MHRILVNTTSGRVPMALSTATALWLGCGTPNPGIVESTEKARPAPELDDGSMTEPEKMRALIDAVRASERTFIQDGEERSGEEAAKDLEYRLKRVASGIPTAHLFIERVGSGRPRATEPDRVRMPDGSEVPMRTWLSEHLAKLEKKQAKTSPDQATEDPQGKSDSPPGILDALRIVERSGLRFVAPPRRSPKGEIKGKRKEYSAAEFAGMLRKKWEFLGKGVNDLDTFIQVIATDALSSMEPYRVILGDGREEEFRIWLEAQLREQAGEVSGDE